MELGKASAYFVGEKIGETEPCEVYGQDNWKLIVSSPCPVSLTDFNPVEPLP